MLDTVLRLVSRVTQITRSDKYTKLYEKEI